MSLHIDVTYRTLPEKQHHALMGHSIGGYGMISICLHHPQKFGAAVALSPANGAITFLNLKLVIPFNEKLFGREQAEQLGVNLMNDILDTADLVFFKETPLLPSIIRDETRKMVNWDSQAWKNWEKSDLNYRMREHPTALK
ncbi:MAG: alpha/beta hydrolase-fold protein [Candidatus Heimdallarchaeota archaeon]